MWNQMDHEQKFFKKILMKNGGNESCYFSFSQNFLYLEPSKKIKIGMSLHCKIALNG